MVREKAVRRKSFNLSIEYELGNDNFNYTHSKYIIVSCKIYFFYSCIRQSHGFPLSLVYLSQFQSTKNN